MRRKSSIVLALAALACLSVGTLAACDEDNANFTGFKEGYATEVKIGEVMMMEDFIDVGNADYTLTATLGDLVVDLSDRPTWSPDTSGIWTFTLTIKNGDNKGTYKADIEIAVPFANWSYSGRTLSYAYEQTVQFTDLLDDLQIDVNTINGWEAYIYSIRIGDDVVINFDENDTEYTFKHYDPHFITFGIVTDEGQSYRAIVRANVQETDVAAEQYLEANNMETFGYQKLHYRDEVLSAEMAPGSYTGYFDNAELPYIAFRGDYGVNSFINVDFTGKNIPQVAFFCDEITSSLYDRNRGFYTSHGVVTNEGGERLVGNWSYLNFYGPIKMKDYHVDTGGNFYREGWQSNPCPASREGLQDGVRYRYIAGYVDAKAGTGNKDDSGETRYGSVTVRMLLINLDTDEIVFDYERKFVSTSSNGVLEEDFFSGSIILYANYGVTTKWDNIRLVQEGVSSIYDLYPTVHAKETAPTYAVKGNEINPADFYEEADLAEGQLYYSLNGSSKVAFNAPLTIPQAGEYRITLVPNDTAKYANSVVLHANDNLTLDFEDGVHNALQGLFRAGGYLVEDPELVLDGEKSGKFIVGGTLPLNTTWFGVDYQYLDRVFADSSVENVVMMTLADADVTIAAQNGYDGNGNRKWASGGISYEKNKITFVSIPRSYYEKSKGNPAYPMYLFSITGGSTKSIPMFNIYVDNVTTGLVTTGDPFVYQETASMVCQFQGTVSAVYFDGVRYTNDDEGVTIVDNTVTIAPALIADKVGKDIQIVALVDEGQYEIINQSVLEEITTFVLNDAKHISTSTVSFGVEGTVSSVQIDGTDLAFTQSGTKLVVNKSELIPYAGSEQKILVVTTDRVTLNIPMNVTTMQLNAFEPNTDTHTENLTPFTFENVGTVEIVGSDVITPYAGNGSLRIELPDMPNGGYHKITIPYEYMEELYAQNAINAFYMYVALSYDGKYTLANGTEKTVAIGVDSVSGLSLSPTYDYYPFAAGTANKFYKEDGSVVRRIALDSNVFAAMKATKQGYSIYVDSATHAGRTEYLYIDDFHVAGNWISPAPEMVVSAENNYTVSGLFGNVTAIKDIHNHDVYESEFTVNGNSITIKSEAFAEYQGSGKAVYVTTEFGVTHYFTLKIEE